MIGSPTILSIAKNLLQQKLVNKIYHSVEIWDTNDQRFPAYRQGDEMIYVGPDDTQFMVCYVRETSGFAVDKIEEIGSAGIKRYKGKAGYRMVFFNDFEKRNHSQLLSELVDFTFYPGVQLKKLITSSDELLKLEAKPKDFTFGASTFYKAIDFNVLITFQAKCEDISIDCGEWPNPLDLVNIKTIS